MKFNHINCLAFSVATSLSIFYILCALFVYLWPSTAQNLLASIVHMKTINYQPYVTFYNAAIGTLHTFVCTYIVTWFSGFIYFKLSPHQH